MGKLSFISKSFVTFVLITFASSVGMCHTVGRQQRAEVEASRYFPFVIPWDDAKTNVVTDVSILSHRIEPVVVRNKYFYGRNSGRRIRFTGVNFTFANNFCSWQDAEKVSAHIAKYGINLVRLHLMDNVWGMNGSIWDTTVKDHRHIDKTQLDHFDYLVSQLEKHNIYVDITLHVIRKFSKEDGFPDSVNDIKFTSDTRVDNFDRRMIELQKEYARDLLTHVNPYTKRSYTNDPGVAIIEINNENSLVGDPWMIYGADLDTLPEPFYGELTELWNRWLNKHYKSDAHIKKAWSKNQVTNGKSIVDGNSVWRLEKINNTEGILAESPAAEKDVASSVHIDITKADGIGWHTQANIRGLTLENNKQYTVTFRAKADSDQTIEIGMALDQADWHQVGSVSNIQLTKEWKRYTRTFFAKNTVPGHCRLSFNFDKNIKIDISGLAIFPGVNIDNMMSESGKSFTIPIFGETYGARQTDWLEFLMDTERAYADEMRVYLKNTLKVKANVIDSQIGFGGLTSIGREYNMDFSDTHNYWNHPSFPHRPWDPADWINKNQCMINALANGEAGTLRDLAEYRVAGKPYTITEYNHPAPNDYQSETLPIIFSFAAAQDWDAVVLHCYGDFGENVTGDKIQGFFEIGSNPSKFAFLPSIAMMYRSGLLGPLKDEVTKRLPITGSARAGFMTTADLWKTIPDIYKTRLSIIPVGAEKLVIKVQKPVAIAKPPVNISFLHFGNNAAYLAASPKGQVLIGFVGGQTITAGSVTYVFDQFGNGFASLTLVPMDCAAINKSNKLLLTVIGKAENQNMIWNADRTSVGSQWGNGPVQLEAIPSVVKIQTNGARKVYALKPDGSHLAEVNSHYDNGVVTFRTGDNDSPWFEIVK